MLYMSEMKFCINLLPLGKLLFNIVMNLNHVEKVFSLRVISGTRKGCALKTLKGKTTRPTMDKVKEAIFNMIGPYFSGGMALDLYGGSGGLGIEALSRGIEKVIFVDYDIRACQIIKENLQKTKFLDRSEVYRNDARGALKALAKRKLQFDYIFLDPPYENEHIEDDIMFIEEHELLCENGTIVVEHHRSVALKDEIGSLKLERREQYGDTMISLYKK